MQARLVADLDGAWRTSVTAEWAEQHSQAREEKEELARLEGADALSVGELVQRAQLTETFRGGDDALARYRELLGTEEDAGARLEIGRLLLTRDDDEGLRWLEQAAERDWQVVLLANALAYDYLLQHERKAEAEVHRLRCEQQAELLERAESERSEIGLDDRLDSPDLPDDLLERVREALAAEGEVAAAYLVRKHTEHLDRERPFYVLGVVPTSYTRALKADPTSGLPLAPRLAERIPLSEVECLVVTLQERSAIARRLAQIEGASLLGDRSHLLRRPDLVHA